MDDSSQHAHRLANRREFRVGCSPSRARTVPGGRLRCPTPARAQQAAAPPTTCIEAEPFALRVTDFSMARAFAAGCIVIVDPTGVAKDGAFVLSEIAWRVPSSGNLSSTGEGDRLVALNDI